VAIIDHGIRSGVAPYCNDLMAELEVSRRTVLRDIDFMRNDLGAPVEYDAKQNGYVYTQPHWSMPNIRLTEGDLLALGIAEKAIQGFGDSPWAEKLRVAFEKLAAGLPDRVAIDPSELTARYDFGMSGIAMMDGAVLSQLELAIRDNRRVEMAYRRLSHDDEKRYTLEPYLLLQRQGAWYLVARDVDREENVPMFNLSRVRELNVLDTQFEYILSDFDQEKYLSETAGAFHTNQEHHVVVDFTGVAAELVEERLWHESQSMRRLRDGRLRFEATVSHLWDMIPWILRWGSLAKVVKPKELVAHIAGETRKMADVYQP
jgi:predicted DNA-binding transcriptional regulator YafY